MWWHELIWERCTASQLRPHNPRPNDFKCFWTNSITLYLSVPHSCFSNVRHTASKLLSSCALYTAREATATQASPALPPASPFAAQLWINCSEWCSPNIQPDFKVSLFGRLQPFSFGKQWQALDFWAPSFLSCGTALSSDLGLFTQVLVEFRL